LGSALPEGSRLALVGCGLTAVGFRKSIPYKVFTHANALGIVRYRSVYVRELYF